MAKIAFPANTFTFIQTFCFYLKTVILFPTWLFEIRLYFRKNNYLSYSFQFQNRSHTFGIDQERSAIAEGASS